MTNIYNGSCDDQILEETEAPEKECGNPHCSALIKHDEEFCGEKCKEEKEAEDRFMEQ